MKLLKNKEVRGALLWQLSVSVIACSLCFLFDVRAGLTAVVLSLLLMMIYCIGTYKRYQRISSLADDINHVLHGVTAASAHTNNQNLGVAAHCWSLNNLIHDRF